jgi:hypothetical protein
MISEFWVVCRRTASSERRARAITISSCTVSVSLVRSRRYLRVDSTDIKTLTFNRECYLR